MKNQHLNSIKAAMFNTPCTYRESEQYYKNQLHNKIQDVGMYASDTFEIEEETEFGTLNFRPLTCRVTNAIEPKTGNNLGNDFKTLRFLDLDYEVRMGKRYKFNNSIWITSNSSALKYVTKSAIVRRANNVLRWIIGEEIIEEPCILGYSLKYGNIYFNDVVNIPQGTLVVSCQCNENTRKIKLNDKFIFGSEVFKVKSISDYLRENTFDSNSVSIIDFEMFIDTKAPDDDFDNQIAGTGKYEDSITEKPKEDDMSIILTPKDRIVLEEQEETFSCALYINGIEQKEEFSFIHNGPSNDYYEFNIIDGNQFKITNKHRCKEDIVVRCVCFHGEKTFNIQLGGLY